MTKNFVIFLLHGLSLTAAGCADPSGEDEGHGHEAACDTPLLNDDFLGESLHLDWRPRAGTEGDHELRAEGSGGDRRGFLFLRDTLKASNISPSDRSAYGLVRPAPDGDFRLRALLVDAPADPNHLSGVLVEHDQDNLVAVGVRGIHELVQAELGSYLDGEFRVGGSGELTSADRVMLELSRQGDEWLARVNGVAVGGGEVLVEGDLFVGPFVGGPHDQVAEMTLEWIEVCPF